MDLDPSNPVLWNNRGYAYALKDDLNSAISDYKESLRLRPDNIDTMYHIASVYYAMRKYNEAYKVYDDILELQPTHLNALFWKRKIADLKK